MDLHEFCNGLKALRKLELLDLRGTLSNSSFKTSILWVKSCHLACMLADNNFGSGDATELGRVLPKCRLRVLTCK